MMDIMVHTGAAEDITDMAADTEDHFMVHQFMLQSCSGEEEREVGQTLRVDNIDLAATQPVFRVSNKVRVKPVSSATETG